MSKIKTKLKSLYTKWDYDKYWSCREKLFDKTTNPLIRFYCKSYVSKTHLRFNADIAYDINGVNNFAERPLLAHKLNGIVIAAGAMIGRKCVISHQVTIGRSNGLAPVIGDNVYIGPGAKIFGGIHIGNNVRIGANCVVFEDVPDNATVVLEKPRIIVKPEGYKYFVADENEI